MSKIDKIKSQISFYQYHELGAETWLEDHVRIAIQDFKTGALTWCLLRDLPDDPHPETGRSYKGMWEWQKINAIRPATERDENGFYRYQTLVFCLPRGEGKSYLMNLLVLYRFFTQPRQKIILGANSKDQSKFVSFEIIQELIRNSPKLLQILGQEGIKEKEIRLRDGAGNVASYIRSVSAFTGIFSNITAYVFSEIFDMTNPKFFYQLDSSRRNIPNAQGYIDSTVSDKAHVLYNLYEASPLRNNTDPGILFIYRNSQAALEEDYLHPCMTQKQLESFRTKFIPSEFARYFKNKWDLEDTALFSAPVIRSMRYIGHLGQLGQNQKVIQTCASVIEYEDAMDDKAGFIDNNSVIKNIMIDLMPVPYKLVEYGQPRWASIDEIAKLSDIYDTEWAVGIGLDRADPLKDDITLGARTIMSVMIKGLPGSRSHPNMHIDLEGKVRYMYFIVHIAHIESNELADIQYEIDKILSEYGIVKTLCAERWALQELPTYCVQNDISLELLSPTYEKQRAAFNEMYTMVKTGYLKVPNISVPTHNADNILEEELQAFRHSASKKWYGSEEKRKERGVQDDSVFAVGWNLYGMRHLNPDDFGLDQSSMFMGSFIQEKALTGNYR